MPASVERGPSVTQPAAGPANPGNAVAAEEAGPANPPQPFVPYPYQGDEVIGGDCVLSIQRRLLDHIPSPSAHQIQMARIHAQDLFEVKVDIIHQMAGLDPTGDWMGQGARALENPRSATGEQLLEKLFRLRDELHEGGVQSDAFHRLRDKILLTRVNNLDETSTT